jgi:hypothetical protein
MVIGRDAQELATHEGLSRSTRIAILSFTVFCYTLTLLALVWSLPATSSSHANDVLDTALLLSGATCLLNFGLALLVVRQKAARRLHGCLSATYLVLCALSWWGAEYHGRALVRWFGQEGHVEYDKMVARIMKSKHLLTGTPTRLNDLLDYDYRIVGMTNGDGSVTIWFGGRVANGRLGYLYHSGAPLDADPFDMRNPFYHITGGWYQD